MTDTLEERIADLEVALAHQQQIAEDLNEVVTKQAAEITDLRRKLDALVRRFLTVEEAVQPEVPVDKPPHW